MKECAEGSRSPLGWIKPDSVRTLPALSLMVKSDPGLVEVALLGDVGVGYAFVLDDHVGDEGVVGGDGERDIA